jgi:MoaA/NifB/PqqE/SkfB family radical SAM enzyme
MVEPSSACNLRCPLCPTGLGITHRERPTLSAAEFERALGWFRHTIAIVTFWNYGEPLLNRELPAMVAFAARRGIRTRISTNGHFLEAATIDALLSAGLSQLIISLDTPDAELYPRYRVRGKLERVERNFRRAVERKRALGARTEIIAQYMLMQGSEDVDAMIAHGEALGADKVVVKTIGIGSSVPEPGNREWALMPEDERHRRHVSRDDLRARVQWEDARCTYVWRNMVLNSDGGCVPCCRDQNAEHDLGKTGGSRTLAAVWNGAAYRDFRRSIRETQRDAVMCQRCPQLVHRDIDPGAVFERAPAAVEEPA